MGSKITRNPNFHSGGMFEGRIQEGLSSGVVQGEEKPHPTRFPMKNKFEVNSYTMCFSWFAQTLMCKSYTGVGDHFEPMDFPRYQKCNGKLMN